MTHRRAVSIRIAAHPTDATRAVCVEHEGCFPCRAIRLIMELLSAAPLQRGTAHIGVCAGQRLFRMAHFPVALGRWEEIMRQQGDASCVCADSE